MRSWSRAASHSPSWWSPCGSWRIGAFVPPSLDYSSACRRTLESPAAIEPVRSRPPDRTLFALEVRGPLLYESQHGLLHVGSAHRGGHRFEHVRCEGVAFLGAIEHDMQQPALNARLDLRLAHRRGTFTGYF